MTDLISRADAIEAICMNDCGGCRPNECGAYLDKSCDVVKVLSALPSAVCDDCIWHVCNYNKVDWDADVADSDDLIIKGAKGIQDGLYIITNGNLFKYKAKGGKVQTYPIVPSAEAEDRLYIKIYADDEPSVKAEKLYQICGETQNREVTEWLKEYFPSAETAQGEWIIHGDPPWVVRECSQCGTKWHHWSGGSNPNYCGHCGARMKGGDSE